MLTRFRPFTPSNSFSLLDSFFSDFDPFFGKSARFTPVHHGPRFDVEKTDSGFALTADVPGLKAEDLEITAEDGVLTVKGTRTIAPPEGYEARRTERSAFSFERSFRLGDRVDPERIEASLEDGVLTVRLGRRPEAEPRRIAIESA